jgi:hypothetical protein
MFIGQTDGGYRGSEQWASGPYLFVAENPSGMMAIAPGRQAHTLYACVRRVRLSQCGHFMMGRIRIGKWRKIVVSGPIGSDGLPHNCGDPSFEDLKPYMTEIPHDIASAYWLDEGHNDVGPKAGAMLRKWARENFASLTKKSSLEPKK